MTTEACIIRVNTVNAISRTALEGRTGGFWFRGPLDRGKGGETSERLALGAC